MSCMREFGIVRRLVDDRNAIVQIAEPDYGAEGQWGESDNKVKQSLTHDRQFASDTTTSSA